MWKIEMAFGSWNISGSPNLQVRLQVLNKMSLVSFVEYGAPWSFLDSLAVHFTSAICLISCMTFPRFRGLISILLLDPSHGCLVSWDEKSFKYLKRLSLCCYMTNITWWGWWNAEEYISFQFHIVLLFLSSPRTYLHGSSFTIAVVLDCHILFHWITCMDVLYVHISVPLFLRVQAAGSGDGCCLWLFCSKAFPNRMSLRVHVRIKNFEVQRVWFGSCW
jgi:hypothetical protein